MSYKVNISAKRIPDHAETDSCIRVVVFERDAGTDSRCVLDIAEFSESINENKTRKDLLLYINEQLENDDVDSFEVVKIRR